MLLNRLAFNTFSHLSFSNLHIYSADILLLTYFACSKNHNQKLCIFIAITNNEKTHKIMIKETINDR